MGDDEEGRFLLNVKGSSKYLPLPIQFDRKFTNFRRSKLKVWRSKEKEEEEEESKYMYFAVYLEKKGKTNLSVFMTI